CNASPARVLEALTVGASDESDARASFSNWGACVDVFAPGVGIVSAVHDADAGGASKSGTSMAAPHVAGVVALHLEDNPTDTQDQVNAALLAGATPDVITDTKGSPDVLLYSQLETITPPPSFKQGKIWSSTVGDGNGWDSDKLRYGSF